MPGEAEAARGDGPDTDEDEDASSVRPSATKVLKPIAAPNYEYP